MEPTNELIKFMPEIPDLLKKQDNDDNKPTR